MKDDWQYFAPIRHQAALAGRVTDKSTGQPIARATVTLSAVPPALKARLRVLADVRGPSWDEQAERPDRTSSALDGSYRFVDLPAGSYELMVEVMDRKYQKQTVCSAEVSARVSGESQLQIVNIQVAPAT